MLSDHVMNLLAIQSMVSHMFIALALWESLTLATLAQGLYAVIEKKICTATYLRE